MKQAELDARASPPRVRQALVSAAARITTPDSFANPRQLIRVDSSPIIIHLLRGLQVAGIQRAVITLGHAAQLLANEIRQHSFGEMSVEFVWCEASSWKRGHASNILAARSMFVPGEPLLMVMSDHIFNQRLLRQCCTAELAADMGAAVLIDDSSSIIEWARPGGAHCQAHCKNGHCGSIVKVTKGERGLVSRIGKKLAGFDAIEAGVYVVRPDVFDVLHRLLVESMYCTLAEAMQVFATEGRLSYIRTDDYEWFGESTVASLPTPHSFSTAVKPEWREHAIDLLRMTSPHLVAMSGYCNAAGEQLPVVPLYDLGDAIGEGCSSVVVQAQLHDPEAPPLSRAGSREGSLPGSPLLTRRRGNLAVKVIRNNLDSTSEALGDVERSVMWEVHVLQQLNHDHIVRVMDVIEVVDATYIVMQRVDGPELTEFLHRHEGRRMPLELTMRFFGHLLAALRHAHRHGFLHCDVKPDNVRLNKACDHAVLTDWGYARQPGERSDGFFCGTPAYASPEQLTGYSPDSVTGRRKLCSATDVWSLGVTFFEMVAGYLPFPAEDHASLIRAVLANKYRLPEQTPIPVAALIESMLALSPHDRYDIDEIIASPHLRALGTIVLPDRPKSDQAALICGSCDDDDTPADCPPTPALDRYLRKLGISSMQCKRLLWTMLYGSMCCVALWSHLSATKNMDVHYELHDD